MNMNFCYRIQRDGVYCGAPLDRDVHSEDNDTDRRHAYLHKKLSALDTQRLVGQLRARLEPEGEIVTPAKAKEIINDLRPVIQNVEMAELEEESPLDPTFVRRYSREDANRLLWGHRRAIITALMQVAGVERR